MCSRSRLLVASLTVLFGLLFAGCSTEFEKDLRSASSELESSGQFSEVALQTDNDLPFENRTDIQVFEAVLEPDADLAQAGEALAEASELSGQLPHVRINGNTWLTTFHDTYSWKAPAELSAADWTEILQFAQDTPATEVDVWQYDGRGELYRPGEVGVVLRVFESTYPAGWREFEALAQAETPSAIENVCVELTAGTDQDPLTALQLGSREKPQWDFFPPVHVSGPADTDIVLAQELMTTAEQRFGPLAVFSFVYWGDIPVLRVAYESDDAPELGGANEISDAMRAEAEDFAEQVNQVLTDSADITVQALPVGVEDPELETHIAPEVFRQEHPELDRRPHEVYGCQLAS
jgi:hypothetical protein